mmetsp:Transcript_60556/g.112399  ORF Transcript_60556/g.112399 Transcript_60556/m.112399 type:complete len:183 (+) Transcript_60556:58-606(+)
MQSGSETGSQDGKPASFARTMLPVVGVGGAVGLFAGFLSAGTLAITVASAAAGIGAGRYLWNRAWEGQKATAAAAPVLQRGCFRETDLPKNFQTSVMQWQLFLQSRCRPAQDLSEEEMLQLQAEFEQLQPEHAKDFQVVQSLVASGQVEDIPVLLRAGLQVGGTPQRPDQSAGVDPAHAAEA